MLDSTLNATIQNETSVLFYIYGDGFALSATPMNYEQCTCRI